jgi:hypothetical protein
MSLVTVPGLTHSGIVDCVCRTGRDSALHQSRYYVKGYPLIKYLAGGVLVALSLAACGASTAAPSHTSAATMLPFSTATATASAPTPVPTAVTLTVVPPAGFTTSCTFTTVAQYGVAPQTLIVQATSATPFSKVVWCETKGQHPATAPSTTPVCTSHDLYKGQEIRFAIWGDPATAAFLCSVLPGAH